MCVLGRESENFNHPLPGLQSDSSGAPEASLSTRSDDGLRLVGLTQVCFSKATCFTLPKQKQDPSQEAWACCLPSQYHEGEASFSLLLCKQRWNALPLPIDLCDTAFLSLEWEPCLLPGNSASVLEPIQQDGSLSRF